MTNEINVREYQRGNHKKKPHKKQKHNTTQYVLDITLRKQTQIT